MPKSKVRKNRKIRKPLKRKIKVIRNSKAELLEGAIALQEREAIRILNYIKQRKETNKHSKQYENLTFIIKALRDSYNYTADLFQLERL